jgi:hypothetical protein
MKRQALLVFVLVGLLLAAGSPGNAAADEEPYAKVEMRGRLCERNPGPVGGYSGPLLQVGGDSYRLDLSGACQKEFQGDGWRKSKDKTVVLTGTLRLRRDPGPGPERDRFPEVKVENIRVVDE